MAITDTAMDKYKRMMIVMLKNSPSSFNEFSKQILKGLRDACIARGHTYEELGRLESQALREVKKEIQDSSYC